MLENNNIISVISNPINEEEDPTISAAQESLEDLLGAMTIDSKKWGTVPDNDSGIAQERKIIQEYEKERTSIFGKIKEHI